MVFSSHLFLFLFLPVALLLYYLVPRRGKHLVLTLVSYLFYGWANPFFVVLMLFSTTIDYLCGLVMLNNMPGTHKTDRRRKISVTVSIITNLALLGYFKYFNFGVANYDAIVAALGLPELRLDLAFRVTLPLGISFYTFQSMSYSIDVYRGTAKGIRNFIDFACYVSMFPQLVAGPIIRFQDIADQLQSRTITIEKFVRGIMFICMGFAKKILFANSCGKVADMVFDASGLSVLDAWYGAIAYAFQIYFDFSGYSDMAIGLGLMLGFVFAKNFDSPYRSKSITEFWRRWHISLSTWLKDYLYIPLGGNRKGAWRTYINLALVMLLGGLWHGASWTFVIWGGIHGVLLALERLLGKKSLYGPLPVALRMFMTFGIVCIAWVFFRSETLGQALMYCRAMFGFAPVEQGNVLIRSVIYQPYYLIWMILAAVVVWFGRQTREFSRKVTPVKAVFVLALFVVSAVLMTTQSFNPFIYFMF